MLQAEEWHDLMVVIKRSLQLGDKVEVDKNGSREST